MFRHQCKDKENKPLTLVAQALISRATGDYMARDYNIDVNASDKGSLGATFATY